MFNLFMGPAMRRVGIITTVFCSAAIGSVTSQHHIRLKKHSGGYTKPDGIAVVPGDKNRLFVVEKGGLIKIVSTDGKSTNPAPFLNATELLGVCDRGYCDEMGLLGLTFHPKYTENGRFFINYSNFHRTKTVEDGATWCSKKLLQTFVSEFKVDSYNPDLADPTSEVRILEIEQPYCNHNAGDLAFGPRDGYLYITSGDGGSGGDPEGYGQNQKTLLGKLLRIDVDNKSGGKNYAIPPDNPFVDDSSTLDEIWAYGLRNPWRISFDTKTDNLFIADVGQDEWEEVNLQPAASKGGQNYGWNTMEGLHCFPAGESCDKNDKSLTMPILEYPHNDTGGFSITGGHVYRGKKEKEKALVGWYFYGDYVSGKIWGTKKSRKGNW
eukprot:CAMPEP_0194271470 /NCGR_PEP_ID=MMETSP0169-20130528/5236_1 /TAXON_ID=218684 /ORGANISM="Corethron pennatum, Strain L29A3" /LENGTH=379 /DNA_ID=CAMNT_0039013819 /DNA_START=7 /DNA_END=1143 /DNA_ORIENTATION=-